MALDNVTFARIGWELPTYQALPLTVTTTGDALVALAGHPATTALPETEAAAAVAESARRVIIIIGRQRGSRRRSRSGRRR